MLEEQLTKRPICPVCKETELTDEELAMYKNQPGMCWFCIADTFIRMAAPDQIPDSAKFGRPGATREEAMARSQAKHFHMPIDTQAVQNGGAPAPGHSAPTLSGSPVAGQLRMNDQERKTFVTNFGSDPAPKIKPTELIVHGATEDTYMKFSIPLPVDTKEANEIKRIMGGMMDIFGKLLKYGPQFTSTLLELQSINPEMFLGGKR